MYLIWINAVCESSCVCLCAVSGGVLMMQLWIGPQSWRASSEDWAPLCSSTPGHSSAEVSVQTPLETRAWAAAPRWVSRRRSRRACEPLRRGECPDAARDARVSRCAEVSVQTRAWAAAPRWVSGRRSRRAREPLLTSASAAGDGLVERRRLDQFLRRLLETVSKQLLQVLMCSR